MTTKTIDLAAIAGLDFAPACDSPDHPAGRHGHTPTEPARWVVLVCHWAPGCTPLIQILCDSFVQAMTRELVAHFTPDPTALITEHLCGACGARLLSPTDLFTVTGEV